MFDYGNSLRAEAKLGGFERAFDYPGFVPAYVRPLFCEGKGPFRWVALSGDPADIAATDRATLEEFPDDERLARWIQEAGEKIAFQGLPARICWLGYGERRRLGLRFNEMVAVGELSAPVVIGRDHLDSGSVASPYRETEGMADESDAIADWPLLNALVNTSSGASWVSIHHGGGVGIGRSIHAGMVCVADGTDSGGREARPRADLGSGDGRHPARRRRLRPRGRGGGGARRAHPDARMSVREIVTVGDPVLRERAREVGVEELRSPAVQQLIDDLIETKRAANGAGIAANQVGETLRVAVVEVEPGNPRYPYKPRGAADGDREPGARAGRRRAGRDRRGLPVGAGPARGGAALRGGAGALPRPRRRAARGGAARADRRHVPARGRPPRRRCCSSTASRTRRRSRPGSTRRARFEARAREIVERLGE